MEVDACDTAGVDARRALAHGSVGELTEVADRLSPLLAPSDRAAMADALARVAARRVRVLVLGEAKRGKSTLVNALFGRGLMPTGALPLTSVAAAVTVADPGADEVSAEVRFLDGTAYPIRPDEVAELVSEAGNPGNVKGVDRVAVSAPSGLLPVGTEVVDTPGTGSVVSANTAESARARSVVDIAVLVVAADPPVSAAELELASDVMATAARLAVVVNKIDLVRPEHLAEVLEFTGRVVRDVVGRRDADPAPGVVPVFPTSLDGLARAGGREPDGLDAVVEWLRAQLAEHGSSDVLASTARSLRRSAVAALDQLRVEHALSRQAGQARDEVARRLRLILDRARLLASAATDRIDGEARRLRGRLDDEHERQVADALAEARAALGDRLPDGPGGPEERARWLREDITGRARARAEAWFAGLAAELDAALPAVAGETLAGLRADLRQARDAAGELLAVPLSVPEEPAASEPPRAPTLSFAEDPAWRELVTGALVDHLPSAVRARRLHRQLDRRLAHAVSRPFGRVRAALQAWLSEATRSQARRVAQTWDSQLAALHRALAEAGRRPDACGPEPRLTDRLAVVEDAVRALDELIAGETSG